TPRSNRHLPSPGAHQHESDTAKATVVEDRWSLDPLVMDWRSVAHTRHFRLGSEVDIGAIPATSARARSSHSTTLSARRTNVAGTSRPIALAVFRLIASTSFVGCSIGMSAGATPSSALPTSSAQMLR